MTSELLGPNKNLPFDAFLLKWYSLQHKINKQNRTVIFVIEMMPWKTRFSLLQQCKIKKSKYRERPLTLLDLNYLQAELIVDAYGGVTS